MANVKKGTKLVCVPCGRKITVTASGISRATIWCCGKPMSGVKKSTKKAARKTKKK